MGKHGTNIHKRADGRWEARVVQGQPVNGKTNYKFLYGDTYQEVEDKKRAFEQALMAQRNAGTVPASSMPYLYGFTQRVAALAASTVPAGTDPAQSAWAGLAAPSAPDYAQAAWTPQAPASALPTWIPQASDTSVSAPRVTVREAALAWLSAKRSQVKESTFAYYHTEVQLHILPVLGDLYLEDVTQQMIADYQNAQMERGRVADGGPLSNKTVSDLNTILKQIFSFASQNGMLEKAPLCPSVSFRPKPVCIFTRKEQEVLEAFLDGEDTPFAIGVRLALHCGPRIGEICALRWEDIDFTNETLRINKTVARIGQTETSSGVDTASTAGEAIVKVAGSAATGIAAATGAGIVAAEGSVTATESAAVAEAAPSTEAIADTKDLADAKTKLVITTPKTEYSIRTIPIPEVILPYLKGRQGEPSVYVISGTEKFMEPRTCRRQFARLLKRAGVPHHTFHCLRHTFATRCIENGVDIKALSEILGHSDVKVTMQRYVHPSMEYKREQLNKLK